MRQASSTLSWRVKRALSPFIAACSRTSYGAASSLALRPELHVEADLLGLGPVEALRLDQQLDAGRGVELHDELIRARGAASVEAQPRRAAEDQPQLRLQDGQVLARCG